MAKPSSVASMVMIAARASVGRISKAKAQSQIMPTFPRASPSEARCSRSRMPMVIANDIARYISSTSVKIGRVLSVVWFICCALKARSESVISETSAVDFNSSMNRLPQGGIIATKACGRMIRRSIWTRLMLSAVDASHWPRATDLDRAAHALPSRRRRR